MPPKAKFTKEQICEAALQIARQDGMHAITARNLGDRLNSSARPIFTVFQNMEEVQLETIKLARELYNRYIAEGLKWQPAFKGVGKQYIKFACDEPKLFQLLFMTESSTIPDVFHVLAQIDDNHSKILDSIVDTYQVPKETAQSLYRHLWIYSHGIATLSATNVCHFAETEIDGWMTEVFGSLLIQYKKEAKR